MSMKRGVGAKFEAKEILVRDGEMEIEMVVRVKFGMPEQSRHLPHEIERIVEEAGQEFKREMYRMALEKADEELVENLKQREEITGKGKKEYTIKAVFGKVKVDRIRVRHKSKA